MLTDITLGQYFPGNSFIHKLDPRTKLLATLIYIIAIFFAVTPLAYGILTAFAAVVILISRVPWMLVFKSLKPIWIIVILTMLIHMFTAPGEHIVLPGSFEHNCRRYRHGRKDGSSPDSVAAVFFGADLYDITDCTD